MSGYQNVTVCGRLGADPELRHTKAGDAVVTLSISTSDQWTDKKTGEPREETEWHKAVLFGRQAEIAAEYLAKGREVLVTGKLRTRQYQDKNGNDRRVTEIKVNPYGGLVLIGGRGDSEQRRSAPTPSTDTAAEGGDFNDEIPF